LPQETEAILSINLDRFERDDLPKRWRKEQADVWANVWSGLISQAAKVPVINLSRDAERVTRAVAADDSGKPRDFVLIEGRRDMTPVISAIAHDKSFTHKTVGGLPVWERTDLSVTRIGPATLAVGASSEVDELVEVRLGMKPDLKITGQLFDRFQALDRESAIRLISRTPRRPAAGFSSDILERITQFITIARSPR